MTIIFTRTIQESSRLLALLEILDFPSVQIHSRLPEAVRRASLDEHRTVFRNVLIATDIGTRELHVPSVDLVVNYDLPVDGRTYTCRVERMVGDGRRGAAISLVTQYEVELLVRIEKYLGKRSGEYTPAQDEVMAFAGFVDKALRRVYSMEAGAG